MIWFLRSMDNPSSQMRPIMRLWRWFKVIWSKNSFHGKNHFHKFFDVKLARLKGWRTSSIKKKLNLMGLITKLMLKRTNISIKQNPSSRLYTCNDNIMWKQMAVSFKMILNVTCAWDFPMTAQDWGLYCFLLLKSHVCLKSISPSFILHKI